MTAADRLRGWVEGHRLHLAYGVLFAAIAVRNLLGLASSPPGLYVDESSIGYNAYAIGHFGRDEHGATLPLYPEAFGEYKNPVYIYVLALLVRLFGLSVYLTRLPAALFGLATCVFVTLAVLRLTRSHAAAWLTLLLAGVTPWLTLESRLGFEVISMVACLALMLWCLTEAVQRSDRVRELRATTPAPPDDDVRVTLREATRWYGAAGLAAAVAIFAYSTARLEVGLFAGAFFVSFIYPWRRRWWVMLGPLFAGYAVLGWWMLRHPGALTSRFDVISITIDHSTGRQRPLSGIWHLFWANYWQYVGPDFLFVHGDPNTRHNTQWGGMLLLPTAVLLVFGILWALRHVKRAMPRLLLLTIPLGPIAAALTDNGTPHSLRSVDMLPTLLILGGCGVAAILAAVRAVMRFFEAETDSVTLGAELAAIVIAAALLHWGIDYNSDLFLTYPLNAASAFDTGEVDAIATAHRVAGSHHTVYLVADGYLDQPYIQAAFAYAGNLVPPPRQTEEQIPILLEQIGMVQVSDVQTAQLRAVPGDVVVMGSTEPAPLGWRLVRAEGVAADYIVESPV